MQVCASIVIFIKTGAHERLHWNVFFVFLLLLLLFFSFVLFCFDIVCCCLVTHQKSINASLHFQIYVDFHLHLARTLQFNRLYKNYKNIYSLKGMLFFLGLFCSDPGYNFDPHYFLSLLWSSIGYLGTDFILQRVIYFFGIKLWTACPFTPCGTPSPQIQKGHVHPGILGTYSMFTKQNYVQVLFIFYLYIYFSI